jgi:lysozyme
LLVFVTFVAGARAEAAKEAPEEAADCGEPARLHGIDVSRWQGEIDWERVKAAGISFAFIRVSDGMAVVDERFERNWAASRRVGVQRGAYQYFRASTDGRKQAEIFVRAVKRNGRTDLPLVADVETDDGQPPEVLRKQLKRWLKHVEKRMHHRPYIYMSPSMGQVLGRHFRRYQLWLAHYETDCPRVPDGWRRWIFWQHSNKGRVDGISGDVDLDQFAGSARALKRLVKRTRVSGASPGSPTASSAPR